MVQRKFSELKTGDIFTLSKIYRNKFIKFSNNSCYSKGQSLESMHIDEKQSVLTLENV